MKVVKASSVDLELRAGRGRPGNNWAEIGAALFRMKPGEAIEVNINIGAVSGGYSSLACAMNGARDNGHKIVPRRTKAGKLVFMCLE